MYLPINIKGKLIKYSDTFIVNTYMVFDDKPYKCVDINENNEGTCYEEDDKIYINEWVSEDIPKLKKNLILKVDLNKIQEARDKANQKSSNASMANRQSRMNTNKGFFLPEIHDDDNTFNKIIKKYILDNNIDISIYAKEGRIEYGMLTNLKNGLRSNRVMTLERFSFFLELFNLSYSIEITDNSNGNIIFKGDDL